MSLNVDYNLRPDYDEVIQDIANYVINYKVKLFQLHPQN